jgi:hypothetical protein
LKGRISIKADRIDGTGIYAESATDARLGIEIGTVAGFSESFRPVVFRDHHQQMTAAGAAVAHEEDFCALLLPVWNKIYTSKLPDAILRKYASTG